MQSSSVHSYISKSLLPFLLIIFTTKSYSIIYDIESFSVGDVDAAISACASYVASFEYPNDCALPQGDARLADYVYVTNLCADGYPGPDAFNCGHDNTDFILKSAFFYFPHYSLVDTYDEASKQDVCVGNPINPVTGSKIQTEALVAVDGVQPLTFNLIYNSSSLSHWRHSYQRYLTFSNLPTGSRFDTIGSANGYYAEATPETPLALGGSVKAYGKKSAVMLDASPYRALTKQQACEDGWSSFSNNYQFSWKSTAVASYQVTPVSAFATREQCYIYDAPNGNLKMVIDLLDLFSGEPSLPTFSDGTTVNDLYLRFNREDDSVIVFTHYDGIVNQSKTGETLEIIEVEGDRLYRLHTSNDEIEEYASDGSLQSITSAPGHVQTLSYITEPGPGEGMLYQVSNQTGETLTFVYENYGVDTQASRIKTIMDHTGRQWSFTYDPVEFTLISIEMPDGSQRQYHYEDPVDRQLLTGITDETGQRYVSWEYNDKGQAISSAHGPDKDIERVEVDYYANGVRNITKKRVSMLSGPVDIVSGNYTSAVSGSSSVNKVIGHDPVDYEFDADTGNLEYVDDKGQRTEYSNYDNNGNPGIIIEAADTAEQRSTTYTYDPRYHSKIATVTQASVFPGNHKITSYQYDDFGNNTAIIINGFKPDGTAVSRTTTFEYNGPYHQLTRIDGPRSDIYDSYILSYYPDEVTEGSNRARLQSVIDPVGNYVYSHINYTPTDNIQSYLGANNVQVTLSYYYGNDRLKSQELHDPDTGEKRLTEWTYLATGEVETIITGYAVVDKATLTFNYDAGRRLTGIVDGLGNYIEYVLDSEGNIEQEKIYDDAGNLRKQLSQTFDDYDRLQLRTQVNEQRTEVWSADGTLDKVIDGKNVTTDYSYDNLRRLTQINQDMGGSSPQTANALTLFNYDIQDHITTVKNPVNGETVYSYDDLGNLLTRDSGDTGLTVYTYDDAGNVITMTDANGETSYYAYDVLNRLKSITTSIAEDDYYYEYDNCPNGIGRLCKISNNGYAQYYQYDAFGNISSQQALQYSYDSAERLESIRYPSSAIVQYIYDSAGQVQQVAIQRNGVITPLAVNISYEPFGEVKNLLYGNGLTLSQNRDTGYRPLTQIISGVFEVNYMDYDENGNLLQRDEALSNSLSQFSYDAHERLVSASGEFGTRAYNYDNNANRVSLDNNGHITESTYEPLSNRLSMRGLDNVTLDNNGNTLSLGERSYSYTKHNRLFQVFDNGVLKATYGYNGSGQRISKTLPDGSGKTFIYDTDGKLMAETDSNGNILFEYIYLNGKLLAKYTPDIDVDGVSNFEEDGLGTNPVFPDRDSDGINDLDEMFVYGTLLDNMDTDGDGINDGDELALNSNPRNSSINYGDINLNGEFNLGDYVLLMQFVLGTRIPNPAEELQADINRDGVLNIQDMLQMQRVLLGIQISWLDQPVRKLKSLFANIYQSIIPSAYASIGDGELYYVHNDHLGTPVKMTDESGFVVWHATYDPFGKATVNEDVDGDGKNMEMNIRLPGQYYDAESGLHYNYYRYYDPELGRYITSDPIGLSGGMNTYGYVGENPITFIDKYGLDFKGLIRERKRARQLDPRYDLKEFVESNGFSHDADDLMQRQRNLINGAAKAATKEGADAIYIPTLSKLKKIFGLDKPKIDPAFPEKIQTCE